MALDLSRIRSSKTQDRHSWHGAAFIVESLVLLAFLVASLAVAMQLMGVAHERGTEADALSSAIVLASNDAESFTANPTSGDNRAQFVSEDGELSEVGNSKTTAEPNASIYTLTRTVEQSATQAGVLYTAHITVMHDEQMVYQIDTARYVSDAEVGQ